MRPFAITTIELTMTPLQAGAYYEVHEECAAGLNLRFESDEQGVGQARINPLNTGHYGSPHLHAPLTPRQKGRRLSNWRPSHFTPFVLLDYLSSYSEGFNIQPVIIP